MTYYESAEGIKIDRKRAKLELKKHGLEGDWELFIQEVGDKEEYDAQEVLHWLGY